MNGWWVFWGVFCISYALGLLWQALLHKVWGGRILRQAASESTLYLKTGEGEFRIDRRRRQFTYRMQKQTPWQTLGFDDLQQIYLFRATDTASLIEFFLGDWGLWDLRDRYRDLLHSYSIRIWAAGGDIDIPLMTLKQYEQREWLLGQLFLAITLGILKRLHLYRDGEEVARERLALWKGLLDDRGLELIERRQ